jgi:hypothetical protein
MTSGRREAKESNFAMEVLSPENKELRFSGVRCYKGRLLFQAIVKVNREMNQKTEYRREKAQGSKVKD